MLAGRRRRTCIQPCASLIWQEPSRFRSNYGYSLVGRVEQGPSRCAGSVRTPNASPPGYLPGKLADVFPVPDDIPPARAPLASNMETAVTAIWDARPAWVNKSSSSASAISAR